MITIEENVSLRPFNTFGIDVNAALFCKIESTGQLQELIASPLYQNNTRLILGEGSNVLLTRNFPGIVIKIDIGGIDIVRESEYSITLHAGAGESWHKLVMFCVDHDYGGIENLSLIPGTCGAAPIQNIGAYGVEIESCIDKVTAIDASTGELRTFEKEECKFNYRESVFKHELREKYFISSITLTLTKKNHFFNIQYGALRDTLKKRDAQYENHLSVKAISDAVIEIREQKLPSVHVLGSAGSFFKNPTVSLKHFENLRHTYVTMPSYPSVNQNVKIPAGWLIEQCGWKGKRFGYVGVHEHQSLVLVNYGGGTGEEIFQLAMKIRASVKEKFNVVLETEVNIIG